VEHLAFVGPARPFALAILFLTFDVVLLGCSSDSVTDPSVERKPEASVDAPADLTTPPSPAEPKACADMQDGSECDDGNPCTSGDVCRDGLCEGQPIICPVANLCLEVGTCDPGTGRCAAGPALPDGTACNDGNACTVEDVCSQGQCKGTITTTCPANDCQEPGTCEPLTGACDAARPRTDGTTCEDGNLCTRNDVCHAGLCVSGSILKCEGDGPCQMAQCNSTTGTCGPSQPVADGTACDDQNLCTLQSTCLGGRCVGQGWQACGDSNPCRADSGCDPKTGHCIAGPVPDGAGCEDGNPCTVNDRCVAGRCAAGPLLQCPRIDLCRQPPTCNPTSGSCAVGASVPDGVSCDDGNLCTQVDQCRDGQCQGGNPVVCQSVGACSDPGTCNLTTGKCGAPVPKADGTACNDSDVCTRVDTCRSGNCVGTGPIVCSITRSCEVSAVCNRTDGQCSRAVRTPRLIPLPASLRRGESAPLSGSGLHAARVTVGDRELSVRVDSDARIVVTVPPDLALGRSAMVIANPCAEERLTVEILPRIPTIIAVTPGENPPGWPVLLEVSDLSPTEIASITVNGQKLEPDAVDWPTIQPQPDRTIFAVRTPVSMTPGAATIAVSYAAGSGRPAGSLSSVTTVLSSILEPPPPVPYMFPHEYRLSKRPPIFGYGQYPVVHSPFESRMDWEVWIRPVANSGTQCSQGPLPPHETATFCCQMNLEGTERYVPTQTESRITGRCNLATDECEFQFHRQSPATYKGKPLAMGTMLLQDTKTGRQMRVFWYPNTCFLSCQSGQEPKLDPAAGQDNSSCGP
jgi:hypothetical protein